MTFAPKSSVVIARLLDSEGFSPHTAGMVRKYWRKSIMDLRRYKRVARVIRAFRQTIVPKMTATDRGVFGRYIAMHERMAFDSGLRVGLTALCVEANPKSNADKDRQIAELQKEVLRLNDMILALQEKMDGSQSGVSTGVHGQGEADGAVDA